MKELSKSILFLLIFCSCFFSCKDSTVTPSGTSESNDGLPPYWKYAIYDSLAHTADTLLLHAVDSLRLPDGRSAIRLLYLYRTRTDTVFGTHSGDTLLFYSSEDFITPTLMFVVPFQVGTGWHYPSPDSFTVVAKETVAVPTGNFMNCYKITRVPFEGNFYGGTDYWLDSSIGLIRLHEHWLITIGPTQRNVVWNLLSYRLF
jgi:hypothetical protein